MHFLIVRNITKNNTFIQSDRCKDYKEEQLYKNLLTLCAQNSPEFVEKFRMNPVVGYSTKFAANLASMVAHSDGFWDSFYKEYIGNIEHNSLFSIQ